MLPVLIAQLVVLLKDTSLGFIIGYFELLRQARSLVEFFTPTFGNQYTFQLYVAAALIYIIINVLLSQLAKLVERRTRRTPRRRRRPTSSCRRRADGRWRGHCGGLIPSPTPAFRSGFPSRAGCATMAVSPGLARARPHRATRIRDGVPAPGDRAQLMPATGRLDSPTGRAAVRPSPRSHRRRSSAGRAPPTRRQGLPAVELLRTTDHKTIGLMYLTASFTFFIIGGLMAMLMRAELAQPGLQFLSPEQYNQLFTMHGTLMLLMFATPLFFAFGNLIMPLQIGSPDVAFPRLNALSFWLFLFGSTIATAGFFTPGGAADFGWTAYAPLSDIVNTPGAGPNMWIAGLAVSGLGTILGGVNFITTIVCLRAPGMTMFRMPIFTWNTLVTSLLILLAFPILTAALFGLLADRNLGAHVYSRENGGAVLWQHLFWFFGHPEVYIIALPFFGIITEIIPVFSRKPLFGYKGMVGATLAIGFLSLAVWAHHMFATGAVLLPFFSFLTYLIAVPTGLKFFNWIGTMWRGQLTFETPMLWSIGFLVTFLLGGLTGVLLASPPLDWHVSDSYFVVAHFHYVVFGTVVFAANAGVRSGSRRCAAG